MARNAGPDDTHGRGRRRWLGGVTGGLAGFAISSATYLLLNPVLENQRGWARELQGPLWNLVPLLTLGGFLLGWKTASRWWS